SLSSENRLSSPASTGVPSLEYAGDTPCLEVNKHNNLQQIVVFCSKTAGTPLTHAVEQFFQKVLPLGAAKVLLERVEHLVYLAGGCMWNPTCVALLCVLGCWLHPEYTGALLFSGMFCDTHAAEVCSPVTFES